jgi:hypothetical protein
VVPYILTIVKEHVIIYIIAGSAGGIPYGLDNVVVQKASSMMNMPDVNVWNSLAFLSTNS